MVEGLYIHKLETRQFYLLQLGRDTTNLTRTSLKTATALNAKTLSSIGWKRLAPKQMVLWDVR